MSALLATHTAIRVARDVGYPKLEVPEPPVPTVLVAEVIHAMDYEPEWVPPELRLIEDLSVPRRLVLAYVFCIVSVVIMTATFVYLNW